MDDLDLSRAEQPASLPGELRDRLRAMVLASSAGGEVGTRLQAAAAPARLPGAVRERLATLVRAHAGQRRSPAPWLLSRARGQAERWRSAAARLSAPLTPRWTGPRMRTALAAGIMLLLVGGATVSLMGRQHPSRGGDVVGEIPPTPGPIASGGGGPTPSPQGGSPGPAVAVLPHATTGTPGVAWPPGTYVFDPCSDDPAPFDARCFPPVAAEIAPGGGGPPPAPLPSPGPPFRIGVTGADPEELAGFAAYMDLVTRQGGIHRRAVEIVQVDAAHPAAGLLATVDLGALPLATSGGLPSWLSAPLLETLAIDSAPLARPDVFDASSPADRQAHLVAEHLLHDTDLTRGRVPTVVVYRTQSGVFAQSVPDAVRAVLAANNVQVVVADYTPGMFTPVPADAAVLSMPTADAAHLLAEATCGVCVPRLGFTGIFSLYDRALAGSLPDGTTLISPYAPPTNPIESDAINRGVTPRGQKVGAGVLHGWATAKEVALALAYGQPDSPSAMSTALASLPSDSLALAPVFLRSGTHERFPEGLLLKLTSQAYQAVSGFRTDPQ